MAYYYLDIMKQALPAATNVVAEDAEKNINTIEEADFQIFGSYDVLYIDNHCKSLAEMKQAHEKRHVLSWQYERQPIFLFLVDSYVKLTEEIFDAKYNPSYPLVLSLIQLDTKGLLETKASLLEFLSVYQKRIEQELKDNHAENTKAVVFWNMGGADLLIAFRTDKLSCVGNILYSLQKVSCNLSNTKLNIFSISSHCAIAKGKPNEIMDYCSEWLVRDSSVRFHAFVETSYGYDNILSQDMKLRMVLGERDYELQPEENNVEQDNIFLLKKIIDQQQPSNGLFPFRSSYILPTIIHSYARKNKNATLQKQIINTIFWKDEDNRLFILLEKIYQKINCITKSSEDSFSLMANSVYHARYSLMGLIKYVFRLQATIDQYDLFYQIRRIYQMIANILELYLRELETTSKNSDSCSMKKIRDFISEMTKDLMLFVTELQHVLSVLALSPHTYMETYSSSMRSLNAAATIWAAYNGFIRTIQNIFSTSICGIEQKNEVLLAPYRGKQSQNSLLFQSISKENTVILLQMNFGLMFDTKLAIYMLSHECGHHVGDHSRISRFKLMIKSMFAVELNIFLDNILVTPLWLLHMPMEKDKDKSQNEYYSLLAKPNKDNDDYQKLILLNLIDNKAELKVIYEDCTSGIISLVNKYIEQLINNHLFKDFENVYAQNYKNDWKGENFFASIVCRAYIKHGGEIFCRYISKIKEIVNCVMIAAIRRMRASLQFDSYQLDELAAWWQSSQYKCIPRQVYNSVSREKMVYATCEIYREIYADLLAVHVLGIDTENYLSLIDRFGDTYPPILQSNRNLCRISTVIHTIRSDKKDDFETTKKIIIDWIQKSEKNTDDVRDAALSIIANMSVHKSIQYMLEYAKDSSKSIDTTLKNLTDKQKERLEQIREWYSCDNTACEWAEYIWKFWKYSMMDTNEYQNV